MAIVSVTEIWPERAGGIVAQRLVRAYRRVFCVVTNSRFDSVATVRLATGIPRIDDIYSTPTETDVGARVKSVSPKQSNDSPFVWEVEVLYSSEVPDPNKQDENPLDRPAKVRWSFAKYQRPIEKDFDGNSLSSSSNETFDPPVEIDDSRPFLTIVRNEGSFNPSLAYAYQDAVSTDIFFGGPVGTAKVHNIGADEQFENSLFFWSVTYEFEFRREGWRRKLLDQGYTELIAGVPTVIVDDNGRTLPQPTLLNGAGKRLSLAKSPLEEAANDNQTFIVVEDGDNYGPAPFTIRVDSEDMLVTSNPGGLSAILIVVRAQNNTTAAAHSIGATVQQRPVELSFKVYKELPFAALALP